MLKTTAFLLLVATRMIAWQGVGPLPANDTPRLREYQLIREQMDRLEISLELDRRDYLPGERICMTASVANLTDQQLTVFHPFESVSISGVMLLQLIDGTWWDAGPRPYVPKDPFEGKVVTRVVPGQRISQAGCFGDKTPLAKDRSSFGSLQPGDYKAVFVYGRLSEVSFRVLKPEGEPLIAKAPVAELDGIWEPRPQRPGCRGVVVGAVRAGDSTVLVRSDPVTDLCHGFSGLDPREHFTRIAEVPGPVSDLHLRAFDDGTVDLTYRDSRGYLGRHVLPRTEIRYGPSGKPVVLWKVGEGRERRRAIADPEPGAR